MSAVCFDKTGTLTEADLDFKGAYVTSEYSVISASQSASPVPGQSGFCKQPDGSWRAPSSSNIASVSSTLCLVDVGVPTASNRSSAFDMKNYDLPTFPLICLEVMATCQSLSLIPKFEFDDHNIVNPITGVNNAYTGVNARHDELVPVGDLLEVELLQATGMFSLEILLSLFMQQDN